MRTYGRAWRFLDCTVHASPLELNNFLNHTLINTCIVATISTSLVRYGTGTVKLERVIHGAKTGVLRQKCLLVKATVPDEARRASLSKKQTQSESEAVRGRRKSSSTKMTPLSCFDVSW